MIELFKIRKLFNLQDITEMLKSSLIDKLNQNNACLFYETMKQCSYKDNDLAVLNYIQKWFCPIIENKQHLLLSFESIKELLLNDRLKISSELEIFNASDSWIQHDTNERSIFAIELIKLIRLPLLSSAALNSLLKGDNSFSKCKRSKQYIESVISKYKCKSYNTFSNEWQNRHYTEDSFYTIANCGINQCSNEYKIYESRSNKSTKEVGIVETSERVRNTLFSNGYIYFLSHRSINSYSTFTKEWKHLTEFPVSYDFCACILMGKIYILNHLAFLIVYDLRTETFTNITQTGKARRKAASAVFGGRIVVSGGCKLFHREKFKTVLVYDHCSDEWSQMPDMLERRNDHASISIRNKLYMMGGSSQRCEVFDTFSRKFAYIKPTWSIYKYDDFPTQHVTVGNKIRIYNEHSLDAAVYDVERDEWSVEKGMELGMEPFYLLFR